MTPGSRQSPGSISIFSPNTAFVPKQATSCCFCFRFAFTYLFALHRQFPWTRPASARSLPCPRLVVLPRPQPRHSAYPRPEPPTLPSRIKLLSWRCGPAARPSFSSSSTQYNPCARIWVGPQLPTKPAGLLLVNEQPRSLKTPQHKLRHYESLPWSLRDTTASFPISIHTV